MQTVFLVFSFHHVFPTQTLYVFVTEEEVPCYVIAIEISKRILMKYSLTTFRQIATSRNMFPVQALSVF
jgi:hypothetical protein